MVNLDKRIDILDLNKNVKEVLKSNNINTIKELWILNKNDLKDIGLSSTDINHIKVKLELIGIDLNKKVY